MGALQFHLLKKDNQSKARLGLLKTVRGDIETPVFMPVGTRGSVKTLTNQHLLDIDAQIILGNTYHLMLRPGMEIMAKAGGLHQLMNWPKPMLTDSGGFQIFSLSELNRITDEGVVFQSHIDGARYFLGPTESMQVQKTIGADIVMAFDQCSPYPSEKPQIEAAMKRTLRWGKICKNFELKPDQSLFGITQGGMFSELRGQSTADLVALDFDGYAIGGLSVGEPAEMMNAMIEVSEPLLPTQKPRYLMGVGTPRNILDAVLRGVDMFDCVLPTRNARNGTAYTWQGKVSIKAGKYAHDFTPLDPSLACYTSQFSKAYLRHLLNVNEITGLTLVTIQNVAFYLDLMKKIRKAIRDDTLDALYKQVCELYPV